MYVARQRLIFMTGSFLLTSALVPLGHGSAHLRAIQTLDIVELLCVLSICCVLFVGE